MASVIKRNRRKWKGVKWIATPFARRWRAWKALAGIQASAALAYGQTRIGSIRMTSMPKWQKASAIADCVVTTKKAATDAYTKMLDKYPGVRPVLKHNQ